MAKKKTIELTPAIKEAVLLLRFHKKKPQRNDPVFMTLAAIGNNLGLTYKQV